MYRLQTVSWHWLLFTLAGLLAFTAACDVEEIEDPCEDFQTCGVDAPLRLTLIEHSARPPANVSVLFKVENDFNRPVAGLTSRDFDIFENRRLVSPFEADLTILPKTGKFQYSIVLLLDLSGSILESESLESLKVAATRFVEALVAPPNSPFYGEVELGLWWFDGRAEIDSLSGFTVRQDRLIDAIDGITEALSRDNSTNLYGAVVQGLQVAQQRVERLRRRDVVAASSVVLFTDGTDQANRVTRADALRAVDRIGTDLSVYTIGLGGEIDERTLEAIGASGFASAANLDELVPRFQEIADLVRDEAGSYYLLEYCSPKRDGDNELGIRAHDGEGVGVLTTRFSATGFSAGCRITR